ncbi:hypothetical protein ASZ90_011007 [hydrocarbon metagenome]|uniref:Uncharacterized protein n=1 Tax=hydrocarbon metagenome TaxID=938273 RepID=A0A0W8FEI4_9ZZZZ
MRIRAAFFTPVRCSGGWPGKLHGIATDGRLAVGEGAMLLSPLSNRYISEEVEGESDRFFMQA